MTDNCPEERDALSTVWPEAKLILCTFHILQQVWRWLHDSKNGVDKFDRYQNLKVWFMLGRLKYVRRSSKSFLKTN